MKRDFSPVYRALMLIAGCVALRLFNNAFPNLIPNISPLMAVAFVGAMYLPRAWGWLVGPVTLLLTDLAFVQSNYLAGGLGAMFSWWTVVSLVVYALAGGLGLLIATHKSLGKIVSGSIICSLLFYVAANTFSWWQDSAAVMTPGYAPTVAGWWQANTVGLPGLLPTWYFLRNGVLGDLFFVFVLLLILDRALLFGHSSAKTSARTA